MRKIVAGTAVGVAAGILGFAWSSDLFASVGGPRTRPDLAILGSAHADGALWELLAELVRLPADERREKVARIASVLREHRIEVSSRPGTPLPPPAVCAAPEAAPEPPESPAGCGSTVSGAAPAAGKGADVADLMATYRSVSDATRRFLRGLGDSEMMRSLERLTETRLGIEKALGISRK
ncbi:MAG: hypothetical protein L0216_10385 [Planctomycetales bacterium]|nr:hypothetical protein [Planctomycetales bacterium]